ncbi:MAG: hypothetical protein FWE14_04440 [Lachnospiraceae bacterium]|nr:hypothetical protein [Lachnospiraceae bacterium]
MVKNDLPNIIITRDAPLIIKDPYSVMHYGTILMDIGAYIEIRAGARFQIEKLAYYNNSANLPVSASYPSLAENEILAERNHHIILTGSLGGNGAKGNNGTDWGEHGGRGIDGKSGGNAPANFTLTVKELKFDVTVLSVGGDGGDGGNGGDGANGYDGESSTKPGGIGGNGGNGGAGGRGGNAAQMVTVRYASKNNFEPSVECAASSGGRGGLGGRPGRNGKYYAGTAQPKEGSDGNYGISGNPGSSQIEKIEVESDV